MPQPGPQRSTPLAATLPDRPAVGRGRDFVIALERGLRVLGSFSPETPALGLSDLARRVGLDKRTTYRLASTLQALGYLTQDPDRRAYRPGARVLELGFAVLESMELPQQAQPFLEALGRRYNEFVSLAMLDGIDTVYLATRKVPGISVGIQTYVGYRQPAHCTSHGKVLLAHLPPAELEAFFAVSPLVRRTARTITDANVLRAELELTWRRGYAINDEESSLGLRSVAAAIHQRDGRAVASINLAAPTVRVSRDDLEGELAQAVVESARQIAAQLGWGGATRTNGLARTETG